MLEHLEVAELFDEIMGADRVEASKPNPDMINAILDFYKYDKTTDQAWMVGDNSKDIESAKRAGINAIFAAWGFSADGEYEIIVKEPKEILNIVL
jgi:phosphoglycolate phosphatase